MAMAAAESPESSSSGAAATATAVGPVAGSLTLGVERGPGEAVAAPWLAAGAVAVAVCGDGAAG